MQKFLRVFRPSRNNESVLRGATQVGGDINDVVDNVVKYSNSLIAGEDTVKEDIAVINKITAANVDDLIAQSN